MLLEIVAVSFVTQTALLTARVESRFYRWFEPHRGMLLLLFVYFATFLIAEFVWSFISTIPGYSGIEEYGFDVNRLSDVFGARERMFLILIFSAGHRFYELHSHSWKRLFMEEEWFQFVIAFVMFWVIVNSLWGVLWMVNSSWFS
jgi:hypothetical protein